MDTLRLIVFVIAVAVVLSIFWWVEKRRALRRRERQFDLEVAALEFAPRYTKLRSEPYDEASFRRLKEDIEAFLDRYGSKAPSSELLGRDFDIFVEVRMLLAHLEQLHTEEGYPRGPGWPKN